MRGGRVWFQVSKCLERLGSNVGSPEVSLQASFSSVSFLPSFYEKGEGTVLLALTEAPELNMPSWCPEGREIRYKCFFLDVRDRSNITRMKLFAECPAPGGTQYMEHSSSSSGRPNVYGRRKRTCFMNSFQVLQGTEKFLRAHPSPASPVPTPPAPATWSLAWSTTCVCSPRW